MRNRRKNLTFLMIFIILLGLVWNLIFYPEELRIRYNFAKRADEINAIAAYIEAQDEFRHFQCIEGDVLLDWHAAPATVQKELQNHCRWSQINMGNKTDYGSFFPTGSWTWWSKNYMIALVHSPELDNSEACTRLHILDPGEECVLRLSDLWAIHYWHAILEQEDAQELAEDVAESISDQ